MLCLCYACARAPPLDRDSAGRKAAPVRYEACRYANKFMLITARVNLKCVTPRVHVDPHRPGSFAVWSVRLGRSSSV